MKASEMDCRVEALLFASGEPLDKEKIAECADLTAVEVERTLERLTERYKSTSLQILEVGKGKYQLTTRKEMSSFIKRLLDQKKDAPLSQAALEVLAVIAYHQPVTRGFVEQIRGVDSSGVINTLVQKNLLEEAGRMDLPGRPIAYRTTTGFLRCFSLSDLEDLPPIEELLSFFETNETVEENRAENSIQFQIEEEVE